MLQLRMEYRPAVKVRVYLNGVEFAVVEFNATSLTNSAQLTIHT